MEEKEEKEEKEVYRERPDLVAALEEKYFRPFELSNRFEGYESDSFAEIMSISEVVGERAVKLMLRVVSFGSTVKYSGITTETEFPWWMFKKNAKIATVIYSVVAIAFIFLGSLLKNDLVWELTDFFNYLMVLPNVLALAALSSIVVKAVAKKVKK